MKILHVATLVTPDGAYGGPMRVAVNQCSALRDRGHDVTIAAGVAGFDEPPADLSGVPARLFPAARVVPGFGYASTRAPAMGRWIRDHAANFDVVHVHLARDLVTIPIVAKLRRLRIPYVVQTHGMIAPRSHPLAAPIDRLWTVKLLNSAAEVLHLNEAERRDLCAVGGPRLRLRQLPNGVPVPNVSTDAHRRKAPPEVLFFARLHERKRPEVFAQAALCLLRAGIRAQFAIVGPPEGAEARVDAIIEMARAEGFDDTEIRREPGVSPDLAGERMAEASVYVLPAVREPFGMTVVEALMLEIPVVICADGGLAEFVTSTGCGLLVDGSPESFAKAISNLLSDPTRARSMGERGRSAVQSTFSIASVGRDLEAIYRRIIDQGSGS